ncbi:MAG TPA: hypothetical protein V6C58_08070 [Allocoleopsis sp.]
MKVNDIKMFIEDSKNEQPNELGEWIPDYDLSTEYVKVYTNKNNNQVVIMHRGTSDMYDVLTDVGLIFNHKKGLRFDASQQIQQLAEQKYKPENITVLGYSLGGLLAEMYASPNVKEVITFNKALIPYDFDNELPNNQYDIRTSADLVSALKKFKKHKNDVTIPSTSLNPIKEHKVDTLDRLPQDKLIGQGLKQLKKYKVNELKLLIKKTSKEKDIKVKITGLNKGELIRLLDKLLQA